MTMTALEETEEGKTKEEKTEKVDGLVEHIMQEARMVLPGVQALFGFQLVCVFSQGFAQIPRIDQYIHVLAIFLSINAFCFLLTPTAIDRQCDPEWLAHDFAMMASRFTLLGMLPLMLSTVLDAYVVFHAILKDMRIAIPLALILFGELFYFWVILPYQKRSVKANVQQV
ncbi:MAG: hypothetical protein KA392_21680 [Candidatus Obscuribacter sp.]|jgi:hypothetical protein|nr:hypothetical protein [Candidatus Obscuribacter sp.]MDQ5966665.1 hypothetical protein [Cyanobacteriota bacterium erpe_2018_sw_39hr_WHONDRS-SW48-000098_B_bin.30]